MDTTSEGASAARRVLGLVAVASWLLIDAVRGAGPLLSGLADDSGILALLAALAAFAAGGVLAWLCALAGRHFGAGTVLLFMLAVVGVLRLGLPLLEGLWLINAGLYLLALALTTVVLAARMALGNGGAGPTIAGTALGAAAAVAEQTLLRTWDAVWRADVLGWVALGIVAVLAVGVGWLCRGLEPVGASRGWWAYGLFWGLTVALLANVAWVNAQADVRMSAGSALAIVSLLTGALLAAQVHRTSRTVVVVLAVLGLGALAVLLLRPGLAAAVALPLATAVAALSAAAVLRPADSSPMRRLGAATVFGLAIVAAPLLGHLDSSLGLTGTTAVPYVLAGAVLVVGAAWFAWNSATPADTAALDDGDDRADLSPDRAEVAPEAGESASVHSEVADASAPQTSSANDRAPQGWIAPGVLVGAAVGLVVAGGLAAWTHATYEAERNLSKDFLIAPTALTWNLHAGVQPRVTGGPAVALDEIDATLQSSAADVIMLQEVDRGRLIAGGTDMLEYLAGELRLPFVYAGAHEPQLGNAILTSRAFGDPRTVTLPEGEDGLSRSAVAVNFMGATFATAHVVSVAEDGSQAEALSDWLDDPQPLVLGLSLAPQPSDTVVDALLGAGFADAQQVLDVPAPTYLGSDPAGLETDTLDHLLGRGVEFTSFETYGVGWSDHLPVVARVATGASAPTDVDVDVNEPQPEAGASASPSASASVSPSASPSPSEN